MRNICWLSLVLVVVAVVGAGLAGCSGTHATAGYGPTAVAPRLAAPAVLTPAAAPARIAAPTPATIQPVASNTGWAPSVSAIGVPNFHKVSDKLYRGGKPSGRGFASLKAMGVRTVVDLGFYFFEVDNLRDRQLAYVHIPFYTYRPKDGDVVRFLRIATDPNSGPVYLHCRKGADRTGMMCAAYRVVVCGWSKDAAIREMTQGGFGFDPTYQNLIRYIRNMDVQQMASRAGITYAAAGQEPLAANSTR